MKSNIVSFLKHKTKSLAQNKARSYNVSQSIIENVISDLEARGYDVYNDTEMLDDFLAMKEMVQAILDKKQGIYNPMIRLID